MTDFYFHEKVKSIQNLPISQLPGRRRSKVSSSKENTRKSSLQWFWKKERYWYITVKKILFAVFTVAAGCLSWWLFTFHNWSLSFLPCWTIQVLTQALHVVRELSETLYLFLKVVSTKAQTRYFQSYSLPKVFSSRLVSFPLLNSFYKPLYIVQNGYIVQFYT